MKEWQNKKNIGQTLLGLLLLCFAVASCMPYSKVPPDQSIPVGSTFTVRTPIAWTKAENNTLASWTVDGFRLQEIVFFKGIADGEPMFPLSSGSKKEEIPVYKKLMNSLEIKEFVEASLARNGMHQIVTKEFRPATLGQLKGFRFEFDYVVESGLKYNGLIIGAKQEDKLLAIMYTGTALYHYGKHLDDVEKIITSVIVK